MTAATTVGENDVLLGRDKAQHSHQGNKRFRDLVQEFRVEYQQSLLREDKKRIAETLISIVTANGGRFLKQDDDDTGHSSRWSVVSEILRYKKVCHALRSARARRPRRTTACCIDTSRRLIMPRSLFSITTIQEEQRRQEVVQEKTTHPRTPCGLRNVEVESAAVLTVDATFPAMPMAVAATRKGFQAKAPRAAAAATLSALPEVAAATSNRTQDLPPDQQNIIQICGCAGTCINTVDIKAVFDDDDGADDDYNAVSVDDQSAPHEEDTQCAPGDYY